MNELAALNAVAERLRTLTAANGYRSNAGQTVFVFRDEFSAPDNPPWLGVTFEGRDPLEGGSRLVGCPQIRVRLNVLIVAAVELNAQSAPDGPLQLIDDTDQCLFGSAGTAAFSASGLTVFPGSALALPFEEGDSHTELQINLAVEFTKRLT